MITDRKVVKYLTDIFVLHIRTHYIYIFLSYIRTFSTYTYIRRKEIYMCVKEVYVNLHRREGGGGIDIG